VHGEGDEMWLMILLMSRLPRGHSMSAGRRPEKARLPTVDSLLIGTTRRLLPTEYSKRRLGRPVTHVKGSRYLGASPWTTLYVKILSETRSQWR